MKLLQHLSQVLDRHLVTGKLYSIAYCLRVNMEHIKWRIIMCHGIWVSS